MHARPIRRTHELKGIAMNRNSSVRQSHRWVCIVFVLTVVGNIAAIALGNGKLPPSWLTYSPLPPLAWLTLSGLYMFVLPYAAKRRGRKPTVSP